MTQRQHPPAFADRHEAGIVLAGQLRHVGKVVERLACNDLTVRTQLPQTGEVGALATGVNNMAEALQTHHGQLEKRIGEATAAVDVLRRARTEATSTGEVWWLPETLRLLAEALAAAGGASDEVTGLADQAVALADAQGEWELAERARSTQLELCRGVR